MYALYALIDLRSIPHSKGKQTGERDKQSSNAQQRNSISKSEKIEPEILERISRSRNETSLIESHPDVSHCLCPFISIHHDESINTLFIPLARYGGQDTPSWVIRREFEFLVTENVDQCRYHMDTAGKTCR